MFLKPITRGSGGTHYSLLAAVWFADLHPLERFDCEQIQIAGKDVETSVEEHWLMLRVREFETETLAAECYERIAQAVRRATIGSRVSAHVSALEAIAKDPEHLGFFNQAPWEENTHWPRRQPEIDGLVWMYRSYVLPEHERIMLYPAGLARLIRPITPSTITEWLAISPTAGTQSRSDKIDLAFSLVAEANAQLSNKLEFLGLVNALEVLTPDKSPSEVQASFISSWKSELKAEISRSQSSGNVLAADELAELSVRLGHVAGSVQNGMRRLLSNVERAPLPKGASAAAFNAVDDLPGAVKGVYAVRSELLHRGRVADKSGASGRERLQDALAIARYLVYCALAAEVSAKDA